MPAIELKQAIIEHLRKTGHEPVDCGAFDYDADDDYPAFCIAAALKNGGRPGQPGHRARRLGQRRADRGQQGARRPVCAGVETETASLAREHNNAQLIGIGGRMHTLEEALAIVDAFVSTPWSEAPRHQRRIDILADYERTHVPPLGARRLSRAEGHTLHRLARLHQRRFAGARVGCPARRAVSPMPR